MDSIKQVLPTMSKDLLRCDPKDHKEGETYFEITKLLQVSQENLKVPLTFFLLLHRATLKMKWI